MAGKIYLRNAGLERSGAKSGYRHLVAGGQGDCCLGIGAYQRFCDPNDISSTLTKQAVTQYQGCPGIILFGLVRASVSSGTRAELPLQVANAADIGGTYCDSGRGQLI